jgi:hypothetical protein
MDLVEPQEIIGRQFVVDDNKILISKANFIDNIFEHYKMRSLKAPCSTIASGTLLHETCSDETLLERKVLTENTMGFSNKAQELDRTFLTL